MPVFKFKSHDEARRALWNFNPDSDYYRRIARLLEFGFRICPPDIIPGIHAFKSIEEANSFNAAALKDK